MKILPLNIPALALCVSVTLTTANPGSRIAHIALASPQQKTKTASPQSAKTSAPKVAAASQVTIDNFSFTPATLTVAVGTTVTWINHDDMPHTVKTTKHLFISQALDTDQKYSYRFTRPGTYEYFCSLHPMMKARVIVK